MEWVSSFQSGENGTQDAVVKEKSDHKANAADGAWNPGPELVEICKGNRKGCKEDQTQKSREKGGADQEEPEKEGFTWKGRFFHDCPMRREAFPGARMC